MVLEKIKDKIGKSFLGIDIGAYSIKIVELAKFGEKIKLENYGSFSKSDLLKMNFEKFDREGFSLSPEVVFIIKEILKETDIRTKKSFFVIPDFLSFFNVIELPYLPPKEIPKIIRAEAEKIFDFPLDEMILDWQIVEGKILKEKSVKILLAAIPKKIFSEYQSVARNCDLEILGLEAEIFSLIRIFIGEEERKKTVAILDFGDHTTNCSIIEKGMLKLSQTIQIGGIQLTKMLADSLNLEFEIAEEIKKENGILGRDEEGIKIRSILMPQIETLNLEIGKIFTNFNIAFKKEVEEIIATGGNALLPGLVDYLRNSLQKPVRIGNALKDIIYPEILNEILNEISCTFPVALGSALKGFQS